MKRIGRTAQYAPVYVITVLIRMNMIYQHDAAILVTNSRENRYQGNGLLVFGRPVYSYNLM